MNYSIVVKECQSNLKERSCHSVSKTYKGSPQVAKYALEARLSR